MCYFTFLKSFLSSKMHDKGSCGFFFSLPLILFIGVENFVKPSPGSCGHFHHSTEELLLRRHNENTV